MKVFKPLKKGKVNYKKIMGFDIETEGTLNNFVLGCFYSEDIKHVCYTKQDVIDFINDPKIQKYDIYATNLSFDFLGVLMNESQNWTICERQGTVYSFKWYQEIVDNKLKKPVNFYDTIRIFPASVEQLGKILNLPKMSHPECFGKIPQNQEQQEELIDYCMNDAKISCLFIENILLPFCKKYNLKTKMTVGSLSMQDFRKNFLDTVLFQEEEFKREIAFKSYYGGRTETYARGVFNNVYCFDVNSLYPSVMRKAYPNPNKSKHYTKGSLYNINKYEGVSDVIVEIPHNIYRPPLPYRQNGKLTFPTGTIKGYYNHNELRLALKHGCNIKQINEQLVFKETYKFFDKFVEHHYSERQKLKAKNNPLEVMEKLILNNLYGKFGFNYKKSSSIIPVHEFDFDKHVKHDAHINPLFNEKFYSIEQANNEAPIYSFPIFASYITSEARILMYEYLSNPQLQYKIVATDTDSIFMIDYAGEIFETKELGGMKLEDNYPVKENCYFIRPKMYMTVKPKCKGIKFNKELAKDQFMSMLNGKSILQDRFIKFRSVLNSQEHHKNGLLQINQVIQIEKVLNLEDTKREWFGLFDKNSSQWSKPLQVNYLNDLYELQLKESEKESRNKAREEKLLTKRFYESLSEDALDSKGADVTDKEFIETEMFWEMQ